MAEKFIKHTGLVVPLDAANVDTDAIIPKLVLARICLTTGVFWMKKANSQTRTSC